MIKLYFLLIKLKMKLSIIDKIRNILFSNTFFLNLYNESSIVEVLLLLSLLI